MLAQLHAQHLKCPSPCRAIQVGMAHGYAEVVQRAAGRYDVLDNTNGEPFYVGEHGLAKLWEPLVRPCCTRRVPHQGSAGTGAG